jgi:hypothetical protein
MSTTTDKAARAADLRQQVSNCLSICQLEMSKASPDLDYAHEFAYKALRFIETLRIMNIGGVKS